MYLPRVPVPGEVIVVAKCLGHWLTTVVPLALVTPLLGLVLNLQLDAYPAMAMTLVAGTPAVSLIGAIGAALTLHARRGGLLIALLVLPLYIPTLIFGIAATSAASEPSPRGLSCRRLRCCWQSLSLHWFSHRWPRRPRCGADGVSAGAVSRQGASPTPFASEPRRR